jgi:hypothetical protein
MMVEQKQEDRFKIFVLDNKTSVIKMVRGIGASGWSDEEGNVENPSIEDVENLINSSIDAQIYSYMDYTPD